MKLEYWNKYWKNLNVDEYTNNLQLQVLRTLNKKPILEPNWVKTIKFVKSNIALNNKSILLELGCGNGLFTRELCGFFQQVIAVDISTKLLDVLKSQNFSNVEVMENDIRNVSFSDSYIDCILFYATIQYLNINEIVVLFQRMYNWLKPGGTIYVGDILDEEKLWVFYNNKDRRKDYFDQLANNNSNIGTWVSKRFIKELGKYIGFSSTKIINQPKFMIYNKFRFEAIFKK